MVSNIRPVVNNERLVVRNVRLVVNNERLVVSNDRPVMNNDTLVVRNVRLVLIASFRHDTHDAGLKLLRSLQTVKFDVEELRRQEKHLPPADGT